MAINTIVRAGLLAAYASATALSQDAKITTSKRQSGAPWAPATCSNMGLWADCIYGLSFGAGALCYMPIAPLLPPFNAACVAACGDCCADDAQMPSCNHPWVDPETGAGGGGPPPVENVNDWTDSLIRLVIEHSEGYLEVVYEDDYYKCWEGDYYAIEDFSGCCLKVDGEVDWTVCTPYDDHN